MKKVKVTLRMGSPGKKFYLFPSSEALYVWTCAIERNEQIQVPEIEELLLEPGGFIEAELRGFEYAYEPDGKFKRLELIRLGRAHQPANSSGLLVTTHTGWVTGGLLPLKPYNDATIDIRIIRPEEARLDLPVLFKDSELEVEEDESYDDEECSDDDEDE